MSLSKKLSHYTRRAALTVVAAAISLAITHFCFGLMAPNAPCLAVDPESAELTVKGHAAEFSFLMRNAGRQPLHIRSVVPDCGCSVIQLPRKVLQPGESQQMRVSASPPRAATRALHFTIKSDCVASPVKVVELKVSDLTEPPFILFTPPSLVLRDVGEDDPVVRFGVKTVEKHGATPWLTGSANADAPAGVTLESVTDSVYQGGPHVLRSYEFRLGFKSEAAGGLWRGTLELLDASRTSKIGRGIPLVVERHGMVFSEPTMAYFASIPGEVGVRKARVRLRTRYDGVNYVISKLEASSPGLTAETDLDNSEIVVITFDRAKSAPLTTGVEKTHVAVSFEPVHLGELQIPVVIIHSPSAAISNSQ